MPQTGKQANIIITCSDPRVTKWLLDENFRKKELGLGKSFTPISATGGIKFFLHEGLMDKLFKQLDILVGHFAPEKIVLLNHLGCGYYKALGLTDLGKMRQEMTQDIKKAAKAIKEKFPNMKIEGYILNHDLGGLETIELN